MIGKNGGQFFTSRTIPAAKQKEEANLQNDWQNYRTFKCEGKLNLFIVLVAEQKTKKGS